MGDGKSKEEVALTLWQMLRDKYPDQKQDVDTELAFYSRCLAIVAPTPKASNVGFR